MGKAVIGMLDEKDLQAIAGLFNQAVSESENRMKAHTESAVSESENRMKAYMESAVSNSENRMKAHMESTVSQSENRTKAYLEANVEKKIQLLAEGHKIILDRLPDADEQEQLKSRVKVLERIVTDMRVEIDELKKAQ